jgi:nucleotide-binding universal stress UspA family protein
MNELNRILVATDLCDRCDDAVTYAMNLASNVGAEVHIVHGAYAQGNPDNLPPEADLSDEVYAARLSAWVEPLDLTEAAAIRVLRGSNPATAILEYATEQEIDLIVVGAERGGLSGLLEGDRLARSIVSETECPVTIVRRMPV